MERHQFLRFVDVIRRLGADGKSSRDLVLGVNDRYRLQYIPFEHINRTAHLVIVGITPGPNQLELAYRETQRLLEAEKAEEELLVEVKKIGAFGGPAMRPNLLKMLRHFRFEKFLGIDDVESLWSDNAHMLHSTSVVPHAAFKAERMFAGGFDEVMDSPLLRECFEDCFVTSVREMRDDALFIGLGPCPRDALEWCIRNGHVRKEQVLGAFCHPSTSGGTKTRYYLREISWTDLHPRDPIRSQCEWLDRAYEEMRASMVRLGVGPDKSSLTSRPFITAGPVTATPKGRRKLGATERIASTPTGTGDIRIIFEEFERAGYTTSNETAKLAEFRSPSRAQTVYVVKTTSRLNRINIMIHPGLRPDVIEQLEGGACLSAEHRFHSNMTRFPKRLNKGKTETAYGWQVTVDTLTDLRRFLEAFRSVTF